MPNKCLKCGAPRHRSSDYRSKNLNLVQAVVGKEEVDDVEDGMTKRPWSWKQLKQSC